MPVALKIDQELRSLIPTLSGDEYAALEDSLRNEGCRDDLIAWGEILVDGHNRYELCEKHHIEYDVRHIEFADRNAAKLWMLRNQLGRRNLNSSQLAMLAAKVATLMSGDNQHTKEVPPRGGTSTQQQANAGLMSNAKAQTQKTQGDAAKEFGVSARSVQRAAAVHRDAEPEVVTAVESGKLSVATAAKLAKKKPATQRKVATSVDPAKAAKKVVAEKPLDEEGCSDQVEPWQEVALATDEIISELKAVAAHMRKAYKIEGEQVLHPGAIKYTRSATVGQILEVVRYLENFKPVAKTSKGIITALDRQKESALRKGAV